MRIPTGVRSLIPLVACAFLAACPFVSGPTSKYELTFEGQITRADNGAVVPGAHVEIWLRRPDEGRTTEVFAQGQTNQAGEFRFVGERQISGAPQHPIFRVTPPAGSGLQPASDEFSFLARSDRSYSYTADIVLQMGSEPSVVSGHQQSP